MKFTYSICTLFLAAFLSSCYKDQTYEPPAPEYLEFTFKGISTEAVDNFVGAEELDTIIDLNANAVSFSPKAILPAGSDSLEYDRSGFAWGEISAGITSQVSNAKGIGLKVLIDPWVEFPPAEASATFDAGDSAAWSDFSLSYQRYIIHFADLAETAGADVFSIGSDMENFVKEQPEFWSTLIDSVREVFSGSLTYSANHKNYDDIPFWGELDYIGINGHWSVSLSETPSVADVENFWESSVIPALSGFESTVQRPVIFTNIGYQSVSFAGETPWEMSSETQVNEEAQNNCLNGFFEAFKARDWCSGAFVSGWSLDGSASGPEDLSQSPRSKLAEPMIQIVYLDSL